MARLIDASGVTVFEGTIVNGGGSLPPEWTVDDGALEIEPTAVPGNAVVLKVDGVTGAPIGTYSLFNTYEPDGNYGVNVGSDGGLGINSRAGASDGDPLTTSIGAGFTSAVRVEKTTGGLLIHGTHVAPAPEVLSPGDMLVWFDQTDGVPKLMVTAKQADGTVVQGLLSLSP